MHSRTFTGGFLMLAAVALAGSMSSSAAGSYSFGLPVSACAFAPGSNPTFQWQGIYNNSTSGTMGLECNVTMTTTFGEVLDFVTIYVDDQSSASNISCQMRLLDVNGDTLHTASTFNTSSTGEHVKVWNALNSFGAANSYVYCVLPARSGASISGVQALWVVSTP